MSLRILIVSHGHPASSAGGAEIAAYQLFQSLRQNDGVTAYFLAGADHRPVRSQARPGISPDDRPDEFQLHGDRFDRFLFAQLAQETLEAFAALLERLQPDVVHFHHYLNIGLELISIARKVRPDLRIVVTLHEYLAICHHYGTMVKVGSFDLCEAAAPGSCAQCFPDRSPVQFRHRQRHIQSCFSRADVFVAPSAFLRDRYVEWGLSAHRITVIENGTQPPAMVPPHRPGRRRSLFGFFGQLHPFKGALELLTAIDLLSSWPPAVSEEIGLRIHGAYLELNERDYVGSFRSLVARHGERVHFAGPYERGDLPGLMASVDWVVVPSIWWENSPLVIQEAFANRRPVLCSDIGGMREKVRPGLDGFHFPARDPVALARLMCRVAGDGRIWDALQQTIQIPTTVAEAAATHLALYLDRTVGFAFPVRP